MLTVEQKAMNYATMLHIERVRNLLNEVAVELLDRGRKHDQSKLASPEVEILTENSHRLASLTFDSPEYRANLTTPDMTTFREHHYARNAHHPQHFKEGVNDMTLVDITEMLVDWKASSELQHNGNILKSIEANGKAFGMSTQLVRILENTAKAMGYL